MLRKADVVRMKQVEHVNNEKAILCSIHHPFIVNLYDQVSLLCVNYKSTLCLGILRFKMLSICTWFWIL